MKDEVKKYDYLWNGKNPKWALLNADPDDAKPQYLIVDTEAKMALVIEDDSIADQVIQQMLMVGVRIVSPGNGF